MKLGLNGKKALVLAARRGLGRAVAERLLLEGAIVAITGPDHERLCQTAAELWKKCQVRVITIENDLRAIADISLMCEKAVAALKGIDILVLNAPGPKDGFFMELGTTEWEESINLSLMSAIRTLYHIVPYMQAQKSGRIIAITTVGVKEPLERMVLSCSIRSAVTSLMKTLATELAPDNILVNCVCPSLIMSGRLKEEFERAVISKGENRQVLSKERTRDVPLRRFGNAREFADVVAFLASERASYITGTTFPVDGGRSRGLL